MYSLVIKAQTRLLNFIEDERYMGWDPYDGLNSRVFKALPFVSKISFTRLAWIQLFKKCPINLRPILGVPKEYNAKGLGLLLSGYCSLYQQGPGNLEKLSLTKQQILAKIDFLTARIKELRSDGMSGFCWGYNFDWQARAFFQPRNTPTVVATSFIGNALLDAYEITGEVELLKMARGACDFILKDLNRSYDEKGNFAFSYSPLDKTVVYNASLLGSRLLSRVYSFTLEEELLLPAKKSIAFCCDHQETNGSWAYGTLDFHQWTDNFHTGYNLECIADYIRFSGDDSYTEHLTIGFDYYIKTFFGDDGISRYYSNSVYPIDIHAPAQLIITLYKLGKFHENKILADKVLSWTFDNMKSEKGYFYYQKNRYYSSKIPYMRWAQAWMFYSMSTYLLHFNN